MRWISWIYSSCKLVIDAVRLCHNLCQGVKFLICERLSCLLLCSKEEKKPEKQQRQSKSVISDLHITTKPTPTRVLHADRALGTTEVRSEHKLFTIHIEMRQSLGKRPSEHQGTLNVHTMDGGLNGSLPLGQGLFALTCISVRSHVFPPPIRWLHLDLSVNAAEVPYGIFCLQSLIADTRPISNKRTEKILQRACIILQNMYKQRGRIGALCS